MIQDKVTNLSYLNQTMGGNKKLVKEIMEVFLKQVPEQLSNLAKAIALNDFGVIKGLAHNMKSSASIMGISTVSRMLNEMEELAKNQQYIDKIKEIDNEVHFILTAAMREIEIEVIKYK